MTVHNKYRKTRNSPVCEKANIIERSHLTSSEEIILSVSRKLALVDWKNRTIPLFKPNSKIDGKYVVTNDIREYKNKGGEFGNIYFTEPYQGILFAVKQPKKEILKQPGMPAMIFREADHWNDLGLHANVVYCYFVKLIEEIPHIFLEYVDGGTLRDWIRDGRCREIRTSLDIAIQVCHGMEHAHNKDLLHRDLKPENILMTKESNPKITDFGLAIQKGEKSVLGGTKKYSSPEQLRKEEIGLESDIFSFGVIMWEMFCKALRPFVARFEDEKYIGHVPDGRRPMALNPEIPEHLEKILEKSVELNRENRYQNFEELRKVLNDVYNQLYKKDSLYYRIEIPDSLANDLNNRGFSYFQLGEEQKAMECWEEALKADPLHFESNYNNGYHKWNKGIMSGFDFIKKLENCFERNLQRTDFNETLAWVYLEQGNVEEIEKIQNSEHKVQDDAFLKALEDPDRPVARLLYSFEPFTSNVEAIAFSPDGKYALIGGFKTSLWNISLRQKVYDLNTIDLLFDNHEGYMGDANSLTYLPDGRYALSGHSDKTLRLWDISTGKNVKIFKGHTESIRSVAISPDGRYAISGSFDKTLRLWDISTEKKVKIFKGHTKSINSVAVSPDGRYAISGSDDGSVRLWDLSTRQEVRRYDGKSGSVHSVVFSHDGRYAIQGNHHGTIHVWEISTGKEVKIFRGHNSMVKVIAISPDDRYVFSAGWDSSFRFWEISSGKEIYRFEEHIGMAYCLAISPDGKYVLSGSNGGFLQLWEMHFKKTNFEKFYPYPKISIAKDVKTNINEISKVKELIKEVNTKMHIKLYINAFQTLADASRIKGYERNNEILGLKTDCGIKGGFVRKKLKNGWCQKIFEGHNYAISALAVSPDGKYVLSGGDADVHSLLIGSQKVIPDYTLRLWDISTGEEVLRFGEYQGLISSVSFLPDGKYALSIGLHDTIIWEVATGREVKRHNERNSFLAISPNGNIAITKGLDKTYIVWEISTGKVIRRIEGNTYQTTPGAISCDGRYFLSGSDHGTPMRLWEILTGKLVKTFDRTRIDLADIDSLVQSIQISQDNKYALLGTADSEPQLWELSTGKEVRTFEGHTLGVNCVDFTPDCNFALSGSNDNTLRLWEILTGKEVKIFTEHTGPINSVAISPNGRYAVSGSSDKTLRLWEFEWDWEFMNPVDWHENAEPYVKNFLTLYNNKWSDEQFDQFYQKLQHAGLGWVRKEGVIKKMIEMSVGNK